jgi:hypothetical protein
VRRLVFLVFICCLLVGPAAFAAGTEKPDFRNVRWGMSIKEVKQAEHLKLVFADEETLGYQAQFAGFECMLMYSFDNDRLYQAGYLFTHSRANQTDFIRDFGHVKAQLKRTYGEPLEDEVIWTDPSYRNDPSRWGLAVITGGLELRSVWEHERTKIVLDLAGENFEISFIVGYYSLEGEVEQEQEEMEGAEA